MPPQTPDIEPVSASEVLVNSWDRQRTTEELLSFISGRQALLESVDLEV